MEDQTKQRWFQLSQLAHVEQDPEKLLALTREINRLLDDEQKGRKRNHTVTHAWKSENLRSAR